MRQPHGTQHIKRIIHADDIKSWSAEVLIVHNYNETFCKFGLLISCEKIKTMAFNTEEDFVIRVADWEVEINTQTVAYDWTTIYTVAVLQGNKEWDNPMELNI